MKTRLLIITVMLFAGLCLAGCEEAQLENNGQGTEVTPGGDDGQGGDTPGGGEHGGGTPGGGGYDPDIEDPLEELPELEKVDDVCEQMEDSKFMEYCYEQFDVNGDGKVSMSEAAALDLSIDCNTAKSFKGIEYFTNLVSFKSTSVETVNFGYNKKLTSLDCSRAPVTVLDLRYNTELSNINVSQCTNLTKLLLADEAPMESVLRDTNFNLVGCTALAAVSLPDNCTVIGGNAFRECTSLVKIKMSACTEIGNNAFYQCSGLTSVTFPESLTEIGDDAFSDCSGLTSVTFNSKVNCKSCVFDGSPCKFYGYGATSDNMMYVPDGILRCVSSLSSKGNVQIPSEVISIGASAFYRCSGLTSVTFPESLTKIGLSAFRGCTGLTSVIFPESLKTIEDHAFRECISLKNVELPSDLAELGGGAFGECSSLTSVTLPSSNLIWSDSFYVSWVEGAAFYKCNSLTELIIPDGLTSIGLSAFQGCTGLTSVIFPESLTSIGASAFQGCSGLTSVDASKCNELRFEYYINNRHISKPRYYMQFGGCSKLKLFSIGCPVPPEIGSDYSVFGSEAEDNATLKVPAGSVDAYKASDWARYFDNIVPLD